VADGIHVNIRLEEHKLCLPVVIGVRADGREELIALADGCRESADSWAGLLRDCARRGMRAPVLAIGALAEIWGAEDKEHALAAVMVFGAAYGAKFPEAAAKITDDIDGLLAFYDYPAGHWVHLRTTNPIESTFATVRHRTKVAKGPGSRAAGLAMAFKLIESAQDRWRAVNAPHLVALVRAGARFERGKLIEREHQDAA
jgi:transposase-like protein